MSLNLSLFVRRGRFCLKVCLYYIENGSWYSPSPVPPQCPEKAFHLAFGPYRLNPKREFFQIEPEQAIALLELMTTEDVTPAIQAEAENVDTNAKAGIEKLKAQRPVQNFIEMGIPEGSTLQFTQSEL